MRKIPWTAVALALALIAGVGLWMTGRLDLRWNTAARSADGEHAHGKESDEESGETRVKGDKVVLDAEAVKAAGLQSRPVAAGSVPISLSALGEVQVPDQRVAYVTPRVSGVVREIYKARGETVRAGDALAAIDSADLGDARAAYDTAATELALAERNVDAWRGYQESRPPGSRVGWLELDQAIAERHAAETELSVAERAYDRLKELQERGLRSRTELITAEADLARAKARIEATSRRIEVLGQVAVNDLARVRQRRSAAETKLQSLGSDLGAADRSPARVIVRSPIPGLVTGRDLTLGQTVDPTARIFSIADPSEVWVTAAIYDQDVRAVRPEQPAIVRVRGLGDEAFKGRVVQVGPQVDEKTRTLPVRVAVQNQRVAAGAGLRPGMFATVDIELSRKPGIVVPLAAVQTVNGESVVFVETPLSEGAAYQRRPVKLGPGDDQVVEVLEGVAEGERVVVANGYLLKSEFERSKIGGGHAH